MSAQNIRPDRFRRRAVVVDDCELTACGDGDAQWR
jgi:hypothetical protein